MRTRALRCVATELGAPRLQILDFFAVFRWAIEGNFGDLLVGKRNFETRAEDAKLFFVEFLLLVRDVLAFARFAEAVALNRARQNYRRASR